MGDHYYTNKPTVESRRERITETIAGQKFQFYVDRGVFSKTGLDFGSRLLIESFTLPEIVGPIGDIGCGWGPIGISIGKNNPDREIIMIDINERAVDLTKLNSELNGVANVQIFQNNLLDGQSNKRFASILTNPPIRAGKKVIFQLFEQAKECLLPNGELWIVIQKKQGASSTIKKLEDLNLVVDIITKSKGYFIVKGKNVDSKIDVC